MAILQINLPDEIIESLKAQVAASGTPTIDDYIVGLIDPEYGTPMTPEFEAEIARRIATLPDECPPVDIEAMIRRLDQKYQPVEAGK